MFPFTANAKELFIATECTLSDITEMERARVYHNWGPLFAFDLLKCFLLIFWRLKCFREWKTNRILNNSHFFFFFSSWGRHLLAIMSLWGITYWGFSVFFPCVQFTIRVAIVSSFYIDLSASAAHKCQKFWTHWCYGGEKTHLRVFDLWRIVEKWSTFDLYDSLL